MALALVAVGTSGCVTRSVRQEVWTDGRTEASLRSYKRGTSTVSKGYDHPAEIAPVRMAHILSRIDIRKGDEEGKRTPAIPLATLYAIADGLSVALEEAGPDQEVVIQSRRKIKSLLIFDHFFLTSLLAYMKNDMLYIHISRADWEVPKRREQQLGGMPETYIGVYPLDFRLVADKGMTLMDHQSVVVQWRDDIFRKPTRTRVTSTGKVVRRQVLMESFEDESRETQAPDLATDLSPAQLRALADLEESRQGGQVSETEYQARRRRILRGGDIDP